jgi:DNA-binding MarR family transcriptional regulator
MIGDENRNLTSRQLGVFLVVCLEESNGGHTVKALAARLNVAKPAITRALDRLGELKFVKRTIDPKDRRSVIIKKTSEGDEFLNYIGNIMETVEKTPNTIILPHPPKLKKNKKVA